MTDRWTLAEELSAFGEDSLVEPALRLSDRELIEIFGLAARIYWCGQARTAAVALVRAAVAILEGRERLLKRSRRRRKSDVRTFDVPLSERLDEQSKLQSLL
jgi:hypothetical protein